MGAAVSAHNKAKYQNHWETVVSQELEDTLITLGFTMEDGSELYHTFREIDSDNGGEISVDEFHEFLGLTKTRFTDRVFGILDTDGSGMLDLKEFMIGIWNYCTYDLKLMSKFAFSIFDIDLEGELNLHECDALMRMLFDTEETDHDLIQLIDSDGSGSVTQDEFFAITESHPHMLQPALDMQRVLRTKFFGVKYWEKETKKRQKEFAAFDSLQNDARQSITEIVLIKYKAKQAEIQRLKDKRQRVFAMQEEAARIEAEQEQEVEKEILEERIADIRKSRVPEEEEELQAWDSLQLLHEQLTAPYTLDEIEEKRAKRAEMWAQYDDACEKARKTIQVKNEQRMDAAESDGKAKADDYLKSDTGKSLISFTTKTQYGVTVGQRWKEGNHMQRLLAPLLLPEHDQQLSLGTVLLTRVSNDPILNAIKAQEEQKVVKDYVYDEIDRVENINASTKKMREADMVEVKADFAMNAGSATTRWERLYVDKGDPESFYYYNLDTGETHEGECAICESCDSVIQAEDQRCFECNAPRSKRNRALFRSIDGLVGEAAMASLGL
uniref:EF-hand domain-containing protein n=1 Tax=Phaeomonas parva TaxID=124430 RepID=A0A7S1XZZ4_9STRA|mmetsp:Transcript_6012/g.16838  ORF Transcript_6012/g.16838 Transcript_6012/m.16838 type:complete len:554 (+) Transcript_6012:391-2052(+)